MLQVTGIAKAYAGVRALAGVSLEVRAGEVHALVGENGAGKSTLIRILTGAVQPDDGRMSFDGREVRHNDPRAARALGIAAIYQQPALFPTLTVEENIALALETGGSWRKVDWRARRRNATRLLAQTGADLDPRALAGSLSAPQQQMVEIARAMGAHARLLILDEPTAALNEREVETLFAAINGMRAGGVGVIYITHRLEELFVIADRVTVLRDGAVIATREIGEVDQTELIRMMVGRELTDVFPKRVVPIGAVALEAKALGCRAAGLHDVNIHVRAGEILGIAGLVGSGRTQLAETLFGLSAADQGDVLLRGERVRIDSPLRAVALGIGHVPEDRRRHGVVLEMPVDANTTLACLASISRFGFLRFATEQDIAARYVRDFSIKTPTLDAAVGDLSGGNQQKVALARWLATKPSVLILDEPTQGIDVGAKAEIHRLMVELAGRGLAIIMISSELPEILGMSDRIAVMRGGTIVATLDRTEATQAKILALALGHAA